MVLQNGQLTLNQNMLDQLDLWRSRHGGHVSQGDAALHLMEIGLQQFDGSGIQLTYGEKIIMAMLCDLYRSVSVKNGVIDPNFIDSVLSGGHYWGLKLQYDQVAHSNSIPEVIVREVADILDMWILLENSYNNLSSNDKKQVTSQTNPGLSSGGVQFLGFDGNNESSHYHVANFFVNEMGLYKQFNQSGSGRVRNSHSRILDTYRKMLAEYEVARSSLKKYMLNASQIIKILNA